MSKHKVLKDLGPEGSHRAQLRAEREAAEAASRKQKKIIAVTVVALIAVIALVIALLVNKNKQAAIDNSTSGGTDVEQIVPPNATENNDAILVFGSAVKEGAIVVDVHSDFQCPGCKTYEDYFGDALFGLAQKGDIELRIHPRTMVGDRIIYNQWSVKASVAATCADAVGRFVEYNKVVFANQPAEGVGFTDEALSVTFAAEAGITGDALTQFQACYAGNATVEWVKEAEKISFDTKVPGTKFETTGINATPTYLANGKLANEALAEAANTNTKGNSQEVVLQALKDAANA
ncbi:MAG: DsbA family protein [Propionibacteriaceae bacterium]|jgi:protein-disulfide isomerase|nr:DsbA family protein [Propionibacteriaceae bacterium]